MGNKNLVVSFSGGETSALMTRLLLTKWRSRYNEVVVLFANTGQENEETLEFVRDCDKAFGFNTIWLEAVPQEGRVGTKHRIVTFETAARKGEPFEAVIQKYGIPNQKFPGCTRELKLRPIRSYLRDLGWALGSYEVAIGIRADESARRSAKAQDDGLVYPLLDWEPTTKPQVNSFWQAQPFRLNLAGYQGNCKTCWKKSFRKLLTVMDEAPQHFDFFERMERDCALIGPEFSKKSVDGYKRTFFRGNKSVADIRAMHAAGGWDRAENDAVVYAGNPVTLDVDAADGCVESCEVDWSDDK
jgi:3'-phosphoadenosine 5'-phosphosulfate sulfotransferase (PAPS reductase)/FAD synthetase